MYRDTDWATVYSVEDTYFGISEICLLHWAVRRDTVILRDTLWLTGQWGDMYLGGHGLGLSFGKQISTIYFNMFKACFCLEVY